MVSDHLSNKHEMKNEPNIYDLRQPVCPTKLDEWLAAPAILPTSICEPGLGVAQPSLEYIVTIVRYEDFPVLISL